MSYYQLPKQGLSPGYYQQLPPGTPLWQEAPVPGWGINPLRAGPQRVGVGVYSDNVPLNSAVLPQYVPIGVSAATEQTTYGAVALGVAGGIILGLAFGWLWFGNKKMTPNWHAPRGEKEALKDYRRYVKEELNRGDTADIVSFEQFVFSGMTGGSDDEELGWSRRGGQKLGKRVPARPVLGTKTTDEDFREAERANEWEGIRPWGSAEW